MRRSFMLAVFAAMLALTGCATKTTLYEWGPYEDQVYAYFKNQDPEEQILVLEEHAKEVQDYGGKLPPGYRAHLGLLYAKVGRNKEFVAALEEEKTFFPESAPYIDRLLINTRSRLEARDDKK